MCMVILFDLLTAQPSGNSKYHGGGEYIKTVFKRLVELNINNQLVVFFDTNRFMDDWVLDIIKSNDIVVVSLTAIEEVKSVFEKYQIDVFYSGQPYFYRSYMMPDGVYKIGTFHGLRLVEKPTDFYEYKYFNRRKIISKLIKYVRSNRISESYRKWYKEAAECYDLIICVSEHTKYAVKNSFPDLVKEIKVCYSPQKYVESTSEDDNKCIVAGKYILLIGCNRWEKNGFRAIQAVDGLKKNGYLKDYKIVTLGTIPNAIKTKIENMDDFVCFDYVEPNELENLYKHCDIFLYPSLNEGFGYPPIEAMKYGVTCVVSGVCSLPEVCENSVYYCNPYDIKEIQNRILMACENKIDKEKILNRMNYVSEKQIRDLDELCHSILREID